MKLGGAGRIVRANETWFTHKKRNKGGFQGRAMLGQTTMVYGAVELEVGEDGKRHEASRCNEVPIQEET
eukprot:1054947-Amphidinium_carterae.1